MCMSQSIDANNFNKFPKKKQKQNKKSLRFTITSLMNI